MAKTKRTRDAHAARKSGRRAALDSFGGPVVVGVITLAVLLLAGIVALSERGGGPGGRDEIPIGEQVQPFDLPNVVSGELYSLAPALGERPIVVVSYMGFF